MKKPAAHRAKVAPIRPGKRLSGSAVAEQWVEDLAANRSATDLQSMRSIAGALGQIDRYQVLNAALAAQSGATTVLAA